MLSRPPHPHHPHPHRLEFPSYARMFAAMMMPCVVTRTGWSPGSSTRRPTRRPRACCTLARSFDRFEAVIDTTTDAEDEVVSTRLEGIIAAGDVEGCHVPGARRRLLEDRRGSMSAIAAVRTGATTLRRRSAIRSASLVSSRSAPRPASDPHEGARVPAVHRARRASFAIPRHAVRRDDPAQAIAFTVPWIVDGASADVVAIVTNGLPLPIHTLNRFVLQPRCRRLVAAATGERVISIDTSVAADRARRAHARRSSSRVAFVTTQYHVVDVLVEPGHVAGHSLPGTRWSHRRRGDRLTYRLKAERARRNPKVASLFSYGPVGS